MRKFNYKYQGKRGNFNEAIYLSDEAYEQFRQIFKVTDDTEIPAKLRTLISNAKTVSSLSGLETGLIAKMGRESPIYVPLIYLNSSSKPELFVISESNPEVFTTSTEQPDFSIRGSDEKSTLTITANNSEPSLSESQVLEKVSLRPQEAESEITKHQEKLRQADIRPETLERTPTQQRKTTKEEVDDQSLAQRKLNESKEEDELINQIQKIRNEINQPELDKKFLEIVTARRDHAKRLELLKEKKKLIDTLPEDNLPEELDNHRSSLLGYYSKAKNAEFQKMYSYSQLIENIATSVYQYEDNKVKIENAKKALAEVIVRFITVYNSNSTKNIADKIKAINSAFDGLVHIDPNSKEIKITAQSLENSLANISIADIKQKIEKSLEKITPARMVGVEMGGNPEMIAAINTVLLKSTNLPFQINVNAKSFSWQGINSEKEMANAVISSLKQQPPSPKLEKSTTDNFNLFNNNFPNFERDLKYFNKLQELVQEAQNKAKGLEGQPPLTIKSDRVEEINSVIDDIATGKMTEGIVIAPLAGKMIELKNQYANKIKELEKRKLSSTPLQLAEIYTYIPSEKKDERKKQLSKFGDAINQMKLVPDEEDIRKQLRLIEKEYGRESKKLIDSYTQQYSQYQRLHGIIHDKAAIEEVDKAIQDYETSIMELEKLLEDLKKIPNLDLKKYTEQLESDRKKLSELKEGRKKLTTLLAEFDNKNTLKTIDEYQSLAENFTNNKNDIQIDANTYQVSLELSIQTYRDEFGKQLDELKRAEQQKLREEEEKITRAIKQMKEIPIPVLSETTKNEILDCLNKQYLDKRKDGFLNFNWLRNTVLTRHKRALAEGLYDLFKDENQMFIADANILAKSASILNLVIEELSDEKKLDKTMEFSKLKEIYQGILKEIQSDFRANMDQPISIGDVINKLSKSEEYKNTRSDKHHLHTFLSGTEYATKSDEVTKAVKQGKGTGKSYRPAFSSGLDRVLDKVIDLIPEDKKHLKTKKTIDQ